MEVTPGVNEAPANGDGSKAYAALFMDALEAAKAVGASDLHIEPTRDGVRLRMRVFGDMQPAWKEIGTEHRQAFLSQVKRLTGLEIGVSGRPQDGRLSMPALGLDLRVNLLPTLYGEKVVLRLLDAKRQFKLEHSGLDPEARQAVERALRNKDGVVLISGPTGSGKTTTLYTMLAALNQGLTNIVTLEDPVEYALDGISQVRIDKKVTFASALRAVLRQDPDVILVGEIRDKETAELAFQAASTGHLVLSTIHANGAAEVVARLLGLGVEPYLVDANLRFSAAQRLVKRLCGQCARRAPAEMVEKLGREFAEDVRAASDTSESFRIQGVGCAACSTGISGRLPILEYLTGEEIRLGLTSRSLRCARTMAQIAMAKAFTGEIDIREVRSLV